MNALKSAASSTANKLLPPFEYRIIFSNIISIIRLNEAFMQDLQPLKGKSGIETDFFSIILKHIDKFKVYADYVSSLKMSQDTLKKFEAESIPFKQFLTERRVYSDRHYLADLLVYPVQRIPRYILLLKGM
jgi:hypothetical protein